MPFDRESKFDVLNTLGQRFRDVPGFELYSSYCIYRESGLRNAALASLREFIGSVRNLSAAEQRRIARELCQIGYTERDVIGLIPKPLASFLLDVLDKWLAEDRSEPAVWAWLALLSNDRSHYYRGLHLHPNDQTLLTGAIHTALDEAAFQMHHVQDGGFIGDTEDAAAAIALAAEYALRLDASDQKRSIISEISYFKSLLLAWKQYRLNDPQNSFPEWCRAKGYEFKFQEFKAHRD